MDITSIDDWLRVNLFHFVVGISSALLVLVVGMLLARLVGSAAHSAMLRTPLRNRGLLVNFLSRTARVVVTVLAGVVALSQLGIDIAPLIAGIGVTGFIVGFAFKDSLSNLAAGLLLLFYQPFEVGDFVEAGGQVGSVLDMSIAATELKMQDGRLAIVPNSRVWSSPIINFNRLGRRRVEWQLSIQSARDPEEILERFRNVLDHDTRVLADPAPELVIKALNESAADLVLRAWVAPHQLEAATSDLRSRFRNVVRQDGAGTGFRIG